MMQLIVSCCANCVIESRFATTNFISTKMKIPLQPMNVKGRYCLSFDAFERANVILERSLRANEGQC